MKTLRLYIFLFITALLLSVTPSCQSSTGHCIVGGVYTVKNGSCYVPNSLAGNCRCPSGYLTFLTGNSAAGTHTGEKSYVCLKCN